MIKVINIRIAKIEDAEKLYGMCLLFNDTTTATTKVKVAEHLEKSAEIVCIAEQEEVLIGFVCGRIESHLSFGSPIGTITEIFVREQYRQKGVATKLFEQIEQEFLQRNVNRFRVFTTSDNEKAVNFYKHQAYHQIHTVMFRKDV